MRLNGFKTVAIWMLVGATCFAGPRRVAAQFGFGKPDAPLTAPPQPVPLTHRFVIYRNYRTGPLPAKNDIIAPAELQQAPIFANAPFLRLKPGDKLYTGTEYRKHKAFSRYTSYYLVLHDGKYYEVEQVKKNTQLELWDASLSLLFDWDVTLETASQFKKFMVLTKSELLPRKPSMT